jgi:hypothetical protein
MNWLYWLDSLFLLALASALAVLVYLARAADHD